MIKLLGWRVNMPFPEPPKSVICLAPHTSNSDFFYGQLCLLASGRRTAFLMKKFWFFFPLKYLLHLIGGVAVDRTKHTSLTERMAKYFNSREKFHLTITPEGSRKLVKDWKTGFYYIALKANIPIELAYIDYIKKETGILAIFMPTGNEAVDLAKIKAHYRDVSAKYPKNYEL